MNRLSYFARETLVSLGRNLMMTFAGVLTVMVSLFLAGGILLVQRAVDHGTERWREGVEFEVFMTVNATDSQISDVRNELDQMKQDGAIDAYRFLDKDAAYAEAKRLFANRREVLDAMTPEVLPTSFRVAPADAAETDALARRFGNRVGVDEVVTASKQIKALLRVTSWIRWGFILLSLILALSSAFLIVNTIRLATYARRREIEVMKLVGASNSFIRVPFMAEGLAQGLIGAGFAVGAVWALKWGLSSVFDRNEGVINTFYLTNGDAWFITGLMLFFGGMTGFVASVFGLRRFLEA
jgi:cell division transport system permease protein